MSIADIFLLERRRPSCWLSTLNLWQLLQCALTHNSSIYLLSMTGNHIAPYLFFAVLFILSTIAIINSLHCSLARIRRQKLWLGHQDVSWIDRWNISTDHFSGFGQKPKTPQQPPKGSIYGGQCAANHRRKENRAKSKAKTSTIGRLNRRLQRRRQRRRRRNDKLTRRTVLLHCTCQALQTIHHSIV